MSSDNCCPKTVIDDTQNINTLGQNNSCIFKKYSTNNLYPQYKYTIPITTTSNNICKILSNGTDTNSSTVSSCTNYPTNQY